MEAPLGHTMIHRSGGVPRVTEIAAAPDAEQTAAGATSSRDEMSSQHALAETEEQPPGAQQTVLETPTES